MHSRTARVLTFPAITAFVLVIVPFLLYFTPWYAAGLHSGLVRELTYAALMVPGLVFFWTLLRVDPVPKAYPYLVALWVTGAEVVGDAVLGLAVIADQHLIAGAYYQALARPWGPTLRADQVIGGGALWILGDLVGLPFLAAQLIQMIKEDEQEAAQVDAELDARAAAAAAQGPEKAGVAPAGADSQPWWESDDRFTGRFRRPEQRSPPGQHCQYRRRISRAQPRGQVGGGDELVRLHGAPGRHVGPGRGVVGEHRDDLPDRHLADPLGQHDDRDRALAAERVDGYQRGRGRREGHAGHPSP